MLKQNYSLETYIWIMVVVIIHVVLGQTLARVLLLECNFAGKLNGFIAKKNIEHLAWTKMPEVASHPDYNATFCWICCWTLFLKNIFIGEICWVNPTFWRLNILSLWLITIYTCLCMYNFWWFRHHMLMVSHVYTLFVGLAICGLCPMLGFCWIFWWTLLLGRSEHGVCPDILTIWMGNWW